MIENKQKFISQIMTSKSPTRTVEDIDETALSYAEIKDLTEKIADYEADIALVKEHTPSDREIFPVMQIKGISYDDKIDVYK